MSGMFGFILWVKNARIGMQCFCCFSQQGDYCTWYKTGDLWPSEVHGRLPRTWGLISS